MAEGLGRNFEKDIESSLLELYDFPKNFQVTLLKYSENIIYKITFTERDPVVFRLHRNGYHTPEELRGEMLWMKEIERDTDLLLPKIYVGRNGDVLQQISCKDTIYYCSVISFLEGTILGELQGAELFTAIEEMGEITAKLHKQSMERDRTNCLREFSWDITNFFSENGVWGSWRAYPGLRGVDKQILAVCEEKITKILNEYGRTPDHYGLIHGDLHFYNIIRKDGKNQIFDFDDCGYGFYLYDLGCTLVTYSRDLKKLTACWLKGYEKIRRLTQEEKELLPMFILLRRIVRLGWLASHWDSDTRKTVSEEYLSITVKMAREWCLR